MLETDTIIFSLLFCAIAATFPFLRAMILRNRAQVKEYLDKVDPEQEMIPVDEASWYYRALKRKHITTSQELNDHLVSDLQVTRLMDSSLRIGCYLSLTGGLVAYAAFTFSLITNTEETKLNIALLLAASSAIIAYLLLKTLLDNSKAINRLREDYLRKSA